MGGYRGVSARWLDVEIRERHERADVLIGVAKCFSSELDPRVGEKLPARSTHAYTDDGTTDPAVRQHARKRDGTNEALRSKYAKSSCANDREREPPGLGQS
jgi:hypothetical protein